MTRAAPAARSWGLRTITRRLDESILVRLVVSFLGLALATVALAALAAFLRERATLRRDFLERLESIAAVKEGELTRWVDTERRTLEFVAARPTLRADAARLMTAAGRADTAAVARIEALLDGARGVVLDMHEVFLLSAVGGKVMASTDRQRIGDYRVSDLFFTHGLRQSYVQNVYVSPVTGRPTLTIATPVRATDGTVEAVLAGHLNLARLDRILAERLGLGGAGETFLVSPFNDVVSSQRFGRPEARRGIHTEGVRRALAGERGAAVYDNAAGREVFGAFRWSAPRQLALLVEMDAAEAYRPARDLLFTILGFGTGTALLLTVGIWFLARRVARPILAVAGAAVRVAGGDFDAIAPAVTHDEVGILARAFNDMTARLRAMYGDLNLHVEEIGRANRALVESQQLIRAVMDNTSNIMIVLDADARFLLVNRRFEDLFGCTSAAVLGRRPLEVLPVDAAGLIEVAARTTVAGHPVVERDLEIAEGGTSRTWHFIAYPLVEAGHAPFGAGIVGVDLSERTRAETERRRLEAGVQQAQKLESLGLLAGGIAHDFNNILTAIVGGASLALAELPPGSASRTDLEQVVTAAERAAKLTRQMLAYAGRASFAIETFDLNRVIEEMAELIAVSVPKNVRLVHDLVPGGAAIRGDRTQASQVVLNLVTNGAEAAGERGGTVRIVTAMCRKSDINLSLYRFTPAPADAYVELTVEDNGTGMTPDTLDKMFDPFYSTKGSGRGLGLAAVLGIVKQSGGTLKVTSGSGKGTTFTVIFPAATEAVREPPPAAAPAVPAKVSGTILLVEDEAVVRRATRRILERAGYTVLEAVNGQEAVDLANREGPRISAVVLDVTMPVMGGAEAFRVMRELGMMAPVIISSGYDEADTFAEFTGDAIDFLQKPYRPDALLSRIRRMTGSGV